MNREETKRIVKLLYVTYPRIYDKSDDEQLKGMTEVWSSCFVDDDYSAVAQALKYYISTDTSGFPPVIGKLKEAIYKIENPNSLTSLEAWNLVKAALKNSLYNSKTEFEKLPVAIQTCIGSPSALRSLATSESSQLDTVIASNFQRNYKEKMTRHKEVAMLPSSIRNMIELKDVNEDTEDKIAIDVKSMIKRI